MIQANSYIRASFKTIKMGQFLRYCPMIIEKMKGAPYTILNYRQ
jgi:hypothetical protein